MTAFKIRDVEIPAADGFWYRMALLDVQQALIDKTGGLDRETVDAIFDGITAHYNSMWEQRCKAVTKA